MFEPWQRELLDSLPVARLATIAREGRPHLVPVCYALASVAAVQESAPISLRKLGEGVLVLGVKEEPGEQRCLVDEVPNTPSALPTKSAHPNPPTH